MLAKRIIPCLDITNGRVVKGTNFIDLIDAGDPVSIAQKYNNEGADEITVLDITATSDKSNIVYSIIEKIAQQVFIPLTIGGGIKMIADVKNLLNSGADKVSINSAAINNPDLISNIAGYYGSQCLVVAIDAKMISPNKWHVFSHGGRVDTGLDAIDWAHKVCQLGAGEILLTSMDKDGTKLGFDLELTKKISTSVSIPVIASGGVGNLQHLADGINVGMADAVLAASIFHFGEYTIKQAKEFLQKNNITVRM